VPGKFVEFNVGLRSFLRADSLGEVPDNLKWISNGCAVGLYWPCKWVEGLDVGRIGVVSRDR
jgi:hypothetical protein